MAEVERTFWRPEMGSAKRSTALLRLPEKLVAEIEDRKPAWQSLNSFLGDLVIRGLGLEPTKYRFEADEEKVEQRHVAAAALVERIDAILVTEAIATVALDHKPEAETVVIPESDADLEW